MSNAPSTLTELVAPLPEPGFLQLLQERKLTLLRGGNAPAYAEILSWNALRHLIDSGEYPRGQDHFRIANESIPLAPDRWTNGGEADIAKLEACLAEGNSLIITHIEPFVPPLAALCADIKSRLKEQVYAGVIVTSGKDGAFKLHYDFEDLIIVQTEGTKRWQIFGPAVPNPIRGIPKQSAPENAPIFDEVLEPGDILFVPAGNWHHCEAGPGRSVHLGIFILPPTGWHGVRKLLSPLIAEEIFRTPLTRLASASELAALEADAKNRLIEKIGQLKFSELLSEWDK
jgi:cupin superfamily protein